MPPVTTRELDGRSVRLTAPADESDRWTLTIERDGQTRVERWPLPMALERLQAMAERP